MFAIWIKPSIRLMNCPLIFERRRMSVIVKDEDGVVSMVTKGALKKCFLYRLC